MVPLREAKMGEKLRRDSKNIVMRSSTGGFRKRVFPWVCMHVYGGQPSFHKRDTDVWTGHRGIIGGPWL